MENILYNGVSFPSEAEYALRRPRIDDLLETALKKPLTMVVAGAGYGKTQALASLLDSTERNVIWLQLTALDNAASRFWERIVYGIRPYSQELAESLNILGYPESIAAFNVFLHLIARTIENSNDYVIVLDDFYLINDDSILNFLENLINARVQNLSIVLISRVQPNLNLSLWYTKGLIALITEDDLKLSRQETDAYFDQLGIALNDREVSEIYAKSEGWVLATYLIGLSIKKGDAQYAASMLDVYALIEHEIFSVASHKLQQLLVKLAILETIPKGLLIELSSHDEEVLKEMSQRSLLMRYDAFSECYHIHNLFRDFLLRRKNRLNSNQIMHVHKIAAQWYIKAGHKTDALMHYLDIGDYDNVFDLILSMDRNLPQVSIEALIAILEHTPEDLLRARPIMLVVKALYMFLNNRIDQAYEVLTRLQAEYVDLPQTEGTRSVLGEIYILLALISIVSQNDDFVHLFMQADACLPNGSVLVDQWLNIAEGINITGIKNPAAGELSRNHQAMMRGMPYGARVMNGCCSGAEYLNAADSCYMTGDMRGAEKNAYEAIFYAREKQQYGIECMANFILVRVYILSGDYEKTYALLNQMKDQLGTLQIKDSLVLYDIIMGWVYVKIGDIDKVPKWIRHEEETKKMLSPVIVGREYLVRSDALLAEGRYHELLAFMTQTDRVYEERGILYALIQNKITRAIIYHYMGERVESMCALNEAYALSSPNNLIIQYVEYGHQMRTVIGAAKRDKRCTIPNDWLDAIYTKSSAYAKQLSYVALTYNRKHHGQKNDEVLLSKREKEVLVCLSNGLTRLEIAHSFDLSINTVKSILQSVYSKLGATNSVDAVRIASSLKLINTLE